MTADTLIDLPRAAPARVLALGAFLKNAVCRVDGRHALLSPNHGDLGTPAACEALEASVERLLACGPVDAIAHDLHPDFPSTRLALALAARLGVPALGVQHHHAHVAMVQAEHGFAGPCVGLALDGVGLGTDGSPWGGEVLWVDDDRWQRRAHLEPIALPGGDAAAREPWRLAAAMLHRLGRADEIERRYGPVVGPTAARTIATLLARRVRCPDTTSAGRWFDAMAGLLGLATRQTDEAEAAIALERCAAAAADDLQGMPSVDALTALTAPAGPSAVGATTTPVAASVIPMADLVAAALALAEDTAGAASADPSPQRRLARAALAFHHGLADRLSVACRAVARDAGVTEVALSGGCFFNQVLRERVGATLTAAGLTVRPPRALSCGDAGLALGQAWVAAVHLSRGPAAASILEWWPCA